METSVSKATFTPERRWRTWVRSNTDNLSSVAATASLLHDRYESGENVQSCGDSVATVLGFRTGGRLLSCALPGRLSPFKASTFTDIPVRADS